jgi:allantoinase
MDSTDHQKYTVICSDRVVIGNTLVPATVHFENGVITKVENGKIASAPEGAAFHDFGNLVIMPGVVDSHVHINDPGRTAWEGFPSATQAAAAGGVTTVVDMPLNCSPVTTTLDALKVKQDHTDGKLWADVALLGGIVPNNTHEIGPMVHAGVVGFKAFMVHSGIDEFPHVEEEHIRAAMSELKKLQDRGRDVVFMFHAEVGGPIDEANKSLSEHACSSSKYETFLRSRPKEAENEAIALIIRLCREYLVRCHIVHLSSSDAVAMLRAAKEEGLPITAETTYHYLYFSAEDVPDGNTLFKCCPPIREKNNRDKLWQALEDGVITQVISDHSPCTTDLKLLEDGDFLKAWGGISSLQLGISIVWTQAKKRGFTVPQIAQWMCLQTAELVKLDDKKGSIAVGKDADFVVWNPEEEFTVEESALYIQNKKTPYHGERLSGTVKRTFLRGQLIYETNEDCAPCAGPLGRLIVPSPAAPSAQ